MTNHYETFLKALRFLPQLATPSTYGVTHRIPDVNAVPELGYDFHLWDRDCTLHSYHASERAPEFEETLEALTGEIVSNSSISEFLKIGRIFSEVVPVSKVVMVKEDHAPQVLRLDDNQLQIWHYDPVTRRAREVKQNHHEAAIHQRIATSLKKPDPMVLEAVIAVNKRLQRIKEDDKIIMIGDRYQTDIACGNLAGIDTALVKPYRPLSDKLSLILARYLMDAPIGAMMSKLAERS